jgi:hypothetical protein
LAVTAIGQRFDFFINDYAVDSLVDDTLASGDASMAISIDQGETATVEFDNFVLRTPYIFYDTFTADDDTWCVGAQDDDWWDGSQEITGGRYVWKANDVYKSVVYRCTPIEAPDDFYLSVDARRVAGPTDAACYILIYRETAEGAYYAFEVCDNQTYRVRLQHEGEWQVLRDWTESSVIEEGEVNTLSVQARGTQFDFFINHRWIESVTDATLAGGDAGLAVSMDEEDTPAFEFDNFLLRAP